MIENLGNFDILLHPSREESFGMTLIEAMAKGLPVVAGKDSGAVLWILYNGINGVLIDVNSPIGIAEGIKSIVEDKIIYKKLSEDGIELIKNKYTEIIVAQHLIELIGGL